MKPIKKSRFFTFIFSFCPGAAEMYMGFMKNGVTMMAVFFLLCGLLAVTAFDFLLAVIAIVWFYGFFHARNIARMDDMTFAQYEDVYVWEEFDRKGAFRIESSKLRIVGAITLILVGGGLLWNYLLDIIARLIPDYLWDYIYPVIDRLPSAIIALALIVAGFILIRGKKKEMENTENAADVVANAELFTQKDNSKEA